MDLNDTVPQIIAYTTAATARAKGRGRGRGDGDDDEDEACINLLSRRGARNAAEVEVVVVAWWEGKRKGERDRAENMRSNTDHRLTDRPRAREDLELAEGWRRKMRCTRLDSTHARRLDKMRSR